MFEQQFSTGLTRHMQRLFKYLVGYNEQQFSTGLTRHMQRLFKYLVGYNELQEQIEMTSPVVTSVFL